ncbi:FAST kinase domain-containing protein 4 isoform X2 [Dermacentor andersoni]|uniref:FAST kinase domain-containing protein 4 isoform X2 n=1 Tax=Dermacentor andersoni TaxID=34620 RepID=UPI0021558206|nr:FAST kinase domain-containing protein 3, mitochondrial-like isoform X2 [Dermacentor andersoni]
MLPAARVTLRLSWMAATRLSLAATRCHAALGTQHVQVAAMGPKEDVQFPVSARVSEPTAAQTTVNFETVCKKVVEGTEIGIPNSAIITALRKLLPSRQQDPRLMECFAHSILWRSRRMDLANLCIVLGLHVKHQTQKGSELEQRVVDQLRTVVRERLSEAESVSDIVWLLETVEHMGAAEHKRRFVLEVQDRALQLVGSLPRSDVRLLVRTLARLKLRPTPLLQAAAFYLSKGPEDASMKEIVSLFHAFHSLSFPEPSVLQQLSGAFVEQLADDTKVSLVAACFTGVGQLSWRHTELLESCSSWIVTHRASCRPADFTACLLSLARLQYMPECSDQLFPVLLEELSEGHFTTMPAVWLDIVWSLVSLGKAQQTHLDSVLQHHFYTPLLEDSSLAVPSRQKLLNIIAVNDLEFPDGPSFPKEMVESIVENHKVPEAGALQRSVREALTQLAPLGRYLSQSPSLPYGLTADGEMIVDKNAQPVLLDSKPQPDHHRIALVVLDYKDFTLHSQVPTGVNALRMRLLKHLGYKLLQVPYTEYDEKKPALQRVRYLHEKLLQCVARS